MDSHRQLTLKEHQAARWPAEWNVHEFEAHLDSLWRNRLTRMPDGQVPSGSGQPFFRFNHRGEIRAQNYVGTIQWKGLQITVIPKVMDTAAGFWPHLVHWLSYSRRIEFPFSEWNAVPSSTDEFLEALMVLFSRKALRLMEQQPFLNYESRVETLQVVRGRIRYSDWINQHVARGTHCSITVEHTPFEFDNRLNRLVKFVARRLQALSVRVSTISELQAVVDRLSEVTDEPMTVMDCDGIVLNRMHESYQVLVDMARFFLELHAGGETQGTARNFSFLVPMERVFEDYLAGFITKHFSTRLPQLQHSEALTMQGAFLLRPDILMNDSQGEQIILDTKYKFRKMVDAKHGIAQADAYQLLTYAMHWGVKRVYLIYPHWPDQPLSPPSLFQVNSPLIAGHQIEMIAVNVPFVFEDLKKAESTLRALLERFF